MGYLGFDSLREKIWKRILWLAICYIELGVLDCRTGRNFVLPAPAAQH